MVNEKTGEIKELSEGVGKGFFSPEIIVQNARLLLFAIVGLLLVLVLSYRVVSSSRVNAEQDYLRAATNYSLLKAEQDEGSLKRLQEILHRRAELRPKYDGLIAQSLFVQGKVHSAKEFAELAMKRGRESFPSYFDSFSKNTLNIYDGNYTEALQEAKSLKQAMLQELDGVVVGDRAYGQVLFAYNLLRIAMLEGKVGSFETERAAWSEFLTQARIDKGHHTIASLEETPLAYKYVIRNFRENGVTLLDYIEARNEN